MRGRRGFALVLVTVGMVLLALAVATVLAALTDGLRATRASGEALRLREAAESGLALTLDSWPVQWNYLPVAGSDSLPFVGLNARYGYRVVVRRMTPVVFLIRSEGVPAGGLPVATRRWVEALVHLPLDSARAARPDTVLPPSLDTLPPVRIPGRTWFSLP